MVSVNDSVANVVFSASTQVIDSKSVSCFFSLAVEIINVDAPLRDSVSDASVDPCVSEI